MKQSELPHIVCFYTVPCSLNISLFTCAAHKKTFNLSVHVNKFIGLEQVTVALIPSEITTVILKKNCLSHLFSKHNIQYNTHNFIVNRLVTIYPFREEGDLKMIKMLPLMSIERNN